MKNQLLLLSLLGVSGSFTAPSTKAATILSQNFDTDPVNYTLPADPAVPLGAQSDPFRVDAVDPSRYWALSNTPGIVLEPSITGNDTVYLAAKNINNDGDGTLQFDQFNPAQIDFSVNATGLTGLTLSITLAGAPGAETENFIRAFTDDDGDGIYETGTPVFNFTGTNNSAYIDTVSGAFTLTTEFTPFTFTLNSPTSADGLLRLRFEIFNDTNNVAVPEAVGLDNILIGGVPEPSSLVVLAGAVGMLGIIRRRRG